MSTTVDYIKVNKANWDERAPEHAEAPAYCFQRLLKEPAYLSDVVSFDIPLLGDISNLNIVHLQCHIATDTLSLARRGAKSVVGLDFSPASLAQARHLAANAAGGDKLSFVEASTYDALNVLTPGSFDLVFTGIGAICWLPSIAQWATIVSSLLKPGGKLFIREGHPALWAIDEKDLSTGHPVVGYPYFERQEAEVWDEPTTYVDIGGKQLGNRKTMTWNHGLGEIVTSLLKVGMRITGLVEHKSVPWCAMPGQMEQIGEFDEWVLKTGKDNLPLTYTLQAEKEE